MSTTERLAQFIVETTYEQLSPIAVETAEKAILDCLGTTLAGSRDPCGRIAADLVAEQGGAAVSTVIGAGFKTSPVLAALANGTAAHALDYDDGSVSFHGHPSTAILPATLALAEAYGSSGKEFLAAYAVAFEIGHRMGEAVNMRHYNLGFHTTSTIGTFRAVAAASRLLGLDVPATRRALGVAASMSSGLNANFGTMTKPLHAGLAARNGILAADLARRGFTANTEIMETKGGWCDVFCAGEGYNLDTMVDHIGDPFCLERPGVIFKLYPCCQGGIPVIEGVLHLRREHNLAPEQVAGMRFGVNYLRPKIMPYARPTTTAEARFSMQYCGAVAMLDGEVGLKQFAPERLDDLALRDMIERVETYVHPTMRDNLAQGAEVDVLLRDGRELHYSVQVPWFESATPVPWEALERKFLDCAEGTLPRPFAERVIAFVRGLHETENVVALGSLLSGCEPQA